MCRGGDNMGGVVERVVGKPRCELCCVCTNKPGPVEADGSYIGGGERKEGAQARWA